MPSSGLVDPFQRIHVVRWAYVLLAWRCAAAVGFAVGTVVVVEVFA